MENSNKKYKFIETKNSQKLNQDLKEVFSGYNHSGICNLLRYLCQIKKLKNRKKDKT